MLEQLLRHIEMHPACFDFETEVDALCVAMRQGLRREGQGLEMIPTYLGSRIHQVETKQQTVLVLDAGGTNLRVAVVAFEGVTPHILYSHQQALPGTQEALTAEGFLEALARVLLPHLSESRRLAFCFSFSATILPSLDAKVAGMSKEVKVSGMEGLCLGEGLRAALRRLGDSGELDVLVLNDTIAAALSILPLMATQGLEGPIGIIHGTGINAAYPDPALQMLINTESGNYAMAHRSPIDAYLDAKSKIPGDHQFEKMCSGAYLGELCRLTLHWLLGADLGLPSPEAGSSPFSPEATEALLALPRLDNQTLSLWLAEPHKGPLADCLKTEADAIALRQVAEAVYGRAAKLLAIEMTAATLESGQGTEADHPLAIVIEGSTYYKSTGLRPQVEAYMAETVPALYGRHVRLLEGPQDANLIGSATAWLTRSPSSL